MWFLAVGMLIAPAAYAQTDTTPPTVNSVGFYATEADATAGTNAITKALIGDDVYVIVQFSENVSNRNTFFSPFVSGLPNIQQRYDDVGNSLGSDPYTNAQFTIIAYDANFANDASACRAASEPPTDRYLCVIRLDSSQHNSAPLFIRLPGTADGGDTVSDVAGNTLAEEYISPNSLTIPANVLQLGTFNFDIPIDNADEMINLNLRFPVNTANSKTYYYLDHNDNGNAEGDLRDHHVLDYLLNGGGDTRDTQGNNHSGSDDARSVIIGRYAVVLPTVAEWQALRADQSNQVPSGWGSSGATGYNTATRTGTNRHRIFVLADGGVRISNDRLSRRVAFQVIHLPVAPTGVSSIPADDGSLTVRWTPVSAIDKGDADITAYTATAAATGQPTRTCTATGATANTCTITGLTNGEVYGITVVATNSVGNGLASEPVMDLPGVPAAPTDVTLTPGDGQIIVSWTLTPAANNGGDEIISYTAYPFIDGGGLVGHLTCTATGAAANTCGIIGLTNGTRYRIIVRARNNRGESRASVSVRATPARSPTPILAAIDDQSYLVGQNVSLTLPESGGGIGELTYTLTPTANIPGGLTFSPTERTLTGVPTTAIGATALTYTVTDANGTTASQAFSITITTPDPLVFDTSVIPTPDAAYTYAFNTLITPLILPPAAGGISPLTYTLSDVPNGLNFNDDTRVLSGRPTAATPATDLSYVVTDSAATPNARTLIFNVTVIAAAQPDVLRFGTVSGINLNLIFPVTTADGKVYYHLDSNNNGNSSSDNVSRNALNNLLNGGADTIGTQDGNHDGSDDQRSVIVSSYSLVLPTLAEMQALRVNQGGRPSGWVDNFYHTATPDMPGHSTYRFFNGTTGNRQGIEASPAAFQVIGRPPTVPAAPTTVAATPADRSLTIRWIPVPEIDNGGAEITAYTATAMASGQSTRTCMAAGATATTCTMTGLSNDIEYRITVFATNNIGNSLASTATFATPMLPPVPVLAAIADQAYVVGQSVSLTLPESASGVGELTYTLMAFPNIPAGLIFNSTERTLTGRPTTDIAAALIYTVTDANGATANRAFSVTITVPDPLLFDTSVIPVPDAAYTYNRNTPIVPLTLPPATGGVPPLTYTLSDVPNGLNFNDDTRILSGRPAAVASVATLNYTVTDDAATANTRTLAFSVTVNPSLQPDVLDLSTFSFVIPIVDADEIINLNLRFPYNTEDRKTYYYLDHNGNGTAEGDTPGNSDTRDHHVLDYLLNGGNDTVDTQPGGHSGSDDERSVIIGRYALVLPTVAEWQALRRDSGNQAPSGWSSSLADYNTATRTGTNRHRVFNLADGSNRINNDRLSRRVAFQVIDLPAAPTSVTAIPADDASLIIRWTPVPAMDNGGAEITTYTATATAVGQPTQTCTAAGATANTCTITGLTNGEVYRITVIAINSRGSNGFASDPVMAVPGVPAAPTSVTLATGDEQIIVSWTLVPAANNGGDEITSYIASATVTATTDNSNAFTCTATGASANTCAIIGLTNGTRYSVIVRAVNSRGESSASDFVFATPAASPTPILAPIADQTYFVGQNVSLPLPESGGGTGMLTYTLTPIGNIPAGLTFSSAERTLTGVPTTAIGATALTYTVTDANNATASQTFSITIISPDPLVFDTSVIPEPDAAYTYTFNTLITPLTLPPATGGVPPLAYTLSDLPNGLNFNDNTRVLSGRPVAVTPATELSYVVADSAPTTNTSTLTFSVTVIAAAQPDVLRFGTVSGTNLNLIFPVTTDDGKVYYHLDSNNNRNSSSDNVPRNALNNLLNGGADIIGTQDGNHDGSDDQRSVIVSSYSLVLPTLAEMQALRANQMRANQGFRPSGWIDSFYHTATPNMPGYSTYRFFSGTTSNRQGNGASPAAFQVIGRPPTAPAAPTSVTVATADSSLTVTWMPVPNIDNGGADITVYTATATASGQPTRTCTANGAMANTCTMTGLTNGTEYSITVVATNRIGSSVASAAATATPVGVSAAPTGVMLTPGNTQIIVTWAPVPDADNGGADITAYTATATASGQPTRTCTAAGATANTCTITSLSNGTEYSITVIATNRIGSSVASAAATATPAGVSAAPTGVMLTPGGTQIIVTWTPVPDADNGGAEITSYTATATALGQPTRTCTAAGATATTCTIIGLTNDTEYSITVVATNRIGSSVASAAATTTTAPITESLLFRIKVFLEGAQ